MVRIINHDMILRAAEIARHLGLSPTGREAWADMQPVVIAPHAHYALIQRHHAPSSRARCARHVGLSVILRVQRKAVGEQVRISARDGRGIDVAVGQDHVQRLERLLGAPDLRIHQHLERCGMAIHAAILEQPRQHSRHAPHMWRILLISWLINWIAKLMLHRGE